MLTGQLLRLPWVLTPGQQSRSNDRRDCRRRGERSAQLIVEMQHGRFPISKKYKGSCFIL